MTSSAAPDTLLADSAWLRALARRLVGDDLAPDLEQDVAVVALSQPASRSCGRAWLATVARNLANSLRRRQQVEQRRARNHPEREPTVSAAELVASAELQQRAVAAVLALPAVYRDTVLQRFLQGLSVHATSVAMGVPEETVRTRQRRALTMLREQLMPARRRSQRMSLFAAVAAWSSAMNAKHVSVAVAVALLSLLIGAVCWQGLSTELPQRDGGPVARVQSELPGKSDETGTTAPVSVTDGQRREAAGQEVVSVPTSALRVRVRWQSTLLPASNVAVLCRLHTETGSFRRTDRNGEVLFGQLEPGSYRIQTHDWNIENVTVAAGEERVVETTMASGTSAVGIVLDSKQRPVANAVILVSAGGTQPQWSFPAGVSDAGGRFELAGLRDFALLGARHRDHGVTDFRLIQGDAPDSVAHKVRLQFTSQQAALHGQVTDEAGKPIARAWVRVGESSARMKPDEEGNLHRPPVAKLATTDSMGRFAAFGLRPGDRRIFVYRSGLAPHREVVALRAGEAHSVHVTLRGGGVLYGTVSGVSGEPVAGATVGSRGYDYPEIGDVKTDQNGRFRLTDLPVDEGAYEVRAKGFSSVRRSWTLQSGIDQQWDVTLAASAVIRGRLVDEQRGGLANWWVGTRSGTRRAKTDEHGRFELDSAAESETLLIRAAAGFRPVVATFDGIAAGGPEQTFVIGPEHGAMARFRGKLVDDVGSPLVGVQVTLSQERWPVIPLTGEITTQADGTFTSNVLPAGSYEIAPLPGRWLFAPVRVQLAPGATHDCGTLRGAKPARLVVELTGSESMVGQAVVVLDAVGRTRVGSGKGRRRVFDRTLPQSYDIVVRVGDRECHRVQIKLAPGADLMRSFDVH